MWWWGGGGEVKVIFKVHLCPLPHTVWQDGRIGSEEGPDIAEDSAHSCPTGIQVCGLEKVEVNLLLFWDYQCH